MSLIEKAKQKIAEEKAAKKAKRLAEENAFAARKKRAFEQIKQFVKELGKIKGHTVELDEFHSSFHILKKGKIIATGGGHYASRTEYDNDGCGYPTDDYYYCESFHFLDEKGSSIYRTESRDAFVKELIERLGL